jgi:hypothetical protein
MPVELLRRNTVFELIDLIRQQIGKKIIVLKSCCYGTIVCDCCIYENNEMKLVHVSSFSKVNVTILISQESKCGVDHSQLRKKKQRTN